MGELFDLFLDFERKLINLVRDLVIRPQAVADSIAAKDKKYLGAFKFYSIMTSIWVVLFTLGNRYFDFFDESFLLPQRLASMMESETNFAFLIGPFVGLVEFFIPFALINGLLFRNNKLSWVNHITLNIHLGGMIQLYELFAFVPLYLLSNSIDLSVLSYPILIFVPILYYGYVHVKIFGKRKFFSFLKPVASLTLVGFVSISFLLEKSFHEMLHRKLFFGKFARYELRPDSTAEYIYNDSLFAETRYENQFPARLIYGVSRYSNSFVFTVYNPESQKYSYQLFSSDKLTSALPSLGASISIFQEFSIHELQSPRNKIVLQGKPFGYSLDTVLFSLLDETWKPIKQRHFIDYLTIYSKAISWKDNILASGRSKAEGKPLLVELSATADSIRSTSSVGDAGLFIDYLEGADGSDELELLFSRKKDGMLKEMFWTRGLYTDGTFHATAQLTIYKDEFTPSSDGRSRSLHKGRVLRLNDSTSIVGFQVMTDSSFAINLTRINRRKSTIEWNSIVTAPADFIYNDEMLIDQDAIYLMGRAVSVFRKDFSTEYSQFPYVVKVNIDSGELKDFHFLPIDERDRYVYHLFGLESIYYVSSSAYQDDQNIFWNLNGNHSYKIRKRDL